MLTSSFSTERLGWETEFDHDTGEGRRFVMVRPLRGDAVRSLGLAAMHGRPAPGGEPRHTGIALVATVADLKAHDAAIITEPEPMAWGRS